MFSKNKTELPYFQKNCGSYSAETFIVSSHLRLEYSSVMCKIHQARFSLLVVAYLITEPTADVESAEFVHKSSELLNLQCKNSYNECLAKISPANFPEIQGDKI